MSNELSFGQYQKDASSTAVFPDSVRLVYAMCGLASESTELLEKLRDRIWPDGEICMSKSTWVMWEYINDVISAGKKLEEAKKRLRGDKGGSFDKQDMEELTLAIKNNVLDKPEAIKEAAPEIGDVLWYAAVLARDLGLNLGDVAAANREKLLSRQLRGVLKGSGDNR